jgi:hypothetical protein
MDFDSIGRVREMREEFVNFLVKMECQLSATFNCNKETTINSGRQMLRKFDAMMNRKLLGSRWSQPDRAYKRMKWFLFPELTPTSGKLHYHGQIYFPPESEDQIRRFLILRNHIWSKCCKGGDVYVKKLDTVDARRKFANYSLKSFWKEDQRENWIFSDEFQR